MNKNEFKRYLKAIFPETSIQENKDFNFVITPLEENLTIHRNTDENNMNVSSMSSSTQHRQTINFDNWIDKVDIPQKEQLRCFFSNKGWTVYNPRGDGFCTIYAIYKDYGDNLEKNFMNNPKKFYINELIKAIGEYFNNNSSQSELYIQKSRSIKTIMNSDFLLENQTTLKNNLKKWAKDRQLPSEISDLYIQKYSKDKNIDNINNLYNFLQEEFKKSDSTLFKNNENPRKIKIEEYDGKIITRTNTENEMELILDELQNSDNLPVDIVRFFPYITKHNILYCWIDTQSREKNLKHLYFAAPGNTLNTIIFTVSGHTYLFQNKNNHIKNQVYDGIKNSQN
jgi:hypothetical protein